MTATIGRSPVEHDPNQTTLDDLAGTPIAPVEGPPADSIRGRFEAFHEANPHVYKAFRKLAFEALAAGKKKIGGRMLWERMRWEFYLRTEGDAVPRLNDHFPPHYVRMLVEEFPQFDGMFETRRLRTL